MNGVQDAPLGLLSFLSFAFSIIAAVLAIDMYKLFRTGEFGKTWRLLIIASVMFALLQVLRMGEILNFRPLREAHLGEIVELCFVMSLAYAFYVQRKLYSSDNKHAVEDDEDAVSEPEEDEHPDHVFEEYHEHDHNEPESSSHWKQYETAEDSRNAP